jgi:hypothetical protein
MKFTLPHGIAQDLPGILKRVERRAAFTKALMAETRGMF